MNDPTARHHEHEGHADHSAHAHHGTHAHHDLSVEQDAHADHADQMPAVRGVQMRQKVARTVDDVPGVAFGFQVDVVKADALGGRPYVLAREGWLEA